MQIADLKFVDCRLIEFCLFWWLMAMKVKVARYSNAHKYLKQKQSPPNLAFLALIGLAIMFTTSSYVKNRIFHVMRDADAISHVKTGEINADVLLTSLEIQF